MVMKRPRIRFDGVYSCLHHYVKFGDYMQSAYRPCFDVYTYRYFRFLPDGQMKMIHTVLEPKDFVPKFIQMEHGSLEKMPFTV